MHISYILEKYFYLEDLKDFCFAEDLKVGGTKGELVDRLCELPLNPAYFLEYLDANDFDDLAEIIEEEHNVELHWRNEKQAIEALSEFIEVNDAQPKKKVVSKNRKKSAAFKEVFDWLSHFQHKKPETREALYEKELDIMASERFGSKNVRTQVNVTDGRIDLEICGVGVELKLPKSENELEIMMKNLRKYKRHYGDNLILVMYFGKGAKRDLIHDYLQQVETLGVSCITK